MDSVPILEFLSLRTMLFSESGDHDFPCRFGEEVISKQNRFVLLEGLGSGAFGQVVRCRGCRGSGQDVALKILKHKDFCAEVSLEAEEEAAMLKELKHPHIAPGRHRRFDIEVPNGSKKVRTSITYVLREYVTYLVEEVVDLSNAFVAGALLRCLRV